MESTEVAQPKATPEVHENVLKARRFVQNFVREDTEAIIIIKSSSRFALLDLQASRSGKYQLKPDELLNERWREALPRPAKVEKPVVAVVLPNPVIPSVVVEPVVVVPSPVVSPVVAAPIAHKKPIGRPRKHPLKNDQVATGPLSGQ